MKTGMIKGEGNAEYHANPSVSTSSMKTFIESKLLYYRKYIAKDCKTKETKAMSFGSAFHEYVLEPEKFDDNYVVMPEDMKATTKAGKDWKADQDRAILSNNDYSDILKLNQSIRENPTARVLLTNGEAEVSWRVPAGAFNMQSRTDWFVESSSAEQVAELRKSGIDIKEGQPIIVDLKTTQELDGWFRGNYGNTIYQFGYQLQLAFYLAVINKIRRKEGGEIVRHFLFVVVEKKAPYDCAVIALDERSFSLAQTQLKYHLGELRKCYESGSWKGYKDRGVIVTGVPEQICEREESDIFDKKTYEDPSKW